MDNQQEQVLDSSREQKHYAKDYALWKVLEFPGMTGKS